MIFSGSNSRGIDLLPLNLMYKVTLFLFLCALCSCMTVKRTNKYYQQAAGSDTKVDALIVPGLAFNDKNWSTLMKRRVIWSWILYEQGMCKNVIYSGGAVYTPYVEAYVMGLYAQKLGIPRSAIFYDTSAQHSVENVYYSYLIAKKQGFRSIALASDRYQTSFLKRFVRRKFRTEILLMPVVKDSVDKYEYLEPKIDLDRAKVRDEKNYRSIRQREPITRRIRGTFAFNIPWKKYKGRKLPEL